MEIFQDMLVNALTPITLISGVGLLMLCMTTRYNHATNRIRQLMAKRDSAEASLEPDIDAEIEIIYLRASLLRKGVLSVAVSAVFSALLVTISVSSRFLNVDMSTLEGITLVAAITLIVISSLLFSAEISLSLKALGLAIEHLPKVEGQNQE